MKCVERRLKNGTKPVLIYPIGDTHIGGLDVAEGKLSRLIEKIRTTDNAYWLGMGDLVEAINTKDPKRWDAYNIPEWLLKLQPEAIREALSCIWVAQVDRLVGMLTPIAHKCLGLLCGNHEDKARKDYGNPVQTMIVSRLRDLASGNPWVEDLTDCAMIRLVLSTTSTSSHNIVIFATHEAGGGGRTKGAEHNRMARICNLTDADITFVSHTHQAAISSPEVRLSIPRSGKIDKVVESITYSANCGCWKNSYTSRATYESRALYQPRLIQAIECVITPTWDKERKGNYPKILLRFAEI